MKKIGRPKNSEVLKKLKATEVSLGTRGGQKIGKIKAGDEIHRINRHGEELRYTVKLVRKNGQVLLTGHYFTEEDDGFLTTEEAILKNYQVDHPVKGLEP